MKVKQQIREKFRKDVFERDSYKCVICSRSDVKLDAHHITNRKRMPNCGYVKENGITLCDCYDGCHFKAEQFNCGYTEWYVIKTKGSYLIEFTAENLYKKINSSYELAYKKSERL
jgi:5-methylcytosine-specific restriction endonuclease McrA